jgi:hypothetical protein
MPLGVIGMNHAAYGEVWQKRVQWEFINSYMVIEQERVFEPSKYLASGGAQVFDDVFGEFRGVSLALILS